MKAKIDVKKIICIVASVLITIFFIYLAISHFSNSYLRLGETFRDLWNSMKYYFFEIFEMEHDTKATVKDYSEIMKWDVSIPETPEDAKVDMEQYMNLLVDKENLNYYNYTVGVKMGDFARILLIVLPFIVLLCILIKMLYLRPNHKHGKETIPLKVAKYITKYTYHPIKRVVLGYWGFLQENRNILNLWLIIWLMSLNLMSIIVAFVAYYLYFSVSCDFLGLYGQFVKLILDLEVAVTTVPMWLFLIFIYPMFDNFRQTIAAGILNHFEMRNRGFINSLPIVSMTCGSMGKKKTTLITDMALSQEVMFRQKAYELLKVNDMRFPNFPWICFELDLRTAMDYGQVYNLATVREWVDKKRARYEKHGDPKKRLYGYDVQRYGEWYDDNLKVMHIYDVLYNYAQLYFIYVIESSLIVSNYSIRTDNELIDAGNFPKWACDFFPEFTSDEGRHSHILDFDVLRLGKKVIENNPNAGSFEFGVVVISEVGKERGNNLEIREIKRNTDETNQKNDLFNSWLKMCRHSATVDNYPFIKVFTDEQRPESWGADARDLCDIIYIESNGKQKLAMPFYTIEEMLTEWAFKGFINLYYMMRYLRGDTTLFIYVLKTLTSWLYQRNARFYNRFGYCLTYIEKEAGTMDGTPERKKYYVLNKKIYSRRFTTDCFSDYFNELARKSNIGLNDYMEYETERASVEELKMQNSYFINALYKNAGSN